MVLKLDKETLSGLSSNLTLEVENYKRIIDSITKDLDSLDSIWKGQRYNEFLTEYIKNKNNIIMSKNILDSFKNITNNALINYSNLSEGVHYNE